MRNSIIISFVFLCMISFSCEKMISDFELRDKPSKLVLNALLDSDSIIKINVSKSLMADAVTNQFPYIGNATIDLFENNQKLKNIRYIGNGDYILESYKPLQDAVYEIEVAAPGLPSVTSKTTIPGEVKILSVDTAYLDDVPETECMGCGTRDLVEFTVLFNDDINTTNYYCIEVKMQQYFIECVRDTTVYDVDDYPISYCVEADTTKFLESVYIMSSGSSTEFFQQGDYFYLGDMMYVSEGQKLYFSNKLFSGSANKFSFKINEWEFYSYIDNSDMRANICYIYLYSFDENIYNFYHSLAQYYQVEDNPLAEKVTLFSNVTDGLGVFSAQQIDSTSINLDPEWFRQDEFYQE